LKKKNWPFAELKFLFEQVLPIFQ